MAQTATVATSPAARREQSWVYFNGDFARYADVRLGLMTHALHYGTGCFEGIRAYWNAERDQLYAMRMADHYDRMRDSTRILRLSLPHSTGELGEITCELLRRNGYREDAYVRPICFKAAEEIGVRLHDVVDAFAIYTVPMGPYVGLEGIRCMVCSWRRIDDTMAPVRAKCTGLYVNSALAKTEAVEAGCDEAIVLTHEGHVSEGSAENVFIVRHGRVITPPPSDNILEGITRATVIFLVQEELGLEVVERSIDRTELYVADEVILCGTGAQVAPVVEVDRRPVGGGRPGPLAQRLQSLYHDICLGRDAKYLDWVTPVY